MSDRGFIGIAVLWLIMAVSVLALAILGQWDEKNGRHQIAEIKMNTLTQSALILERESGFSSADRSHEFMEGQVFLERTAVAAPQEIRVTSSVHLGRHSKRIETRWKRAGDQWQATYWREL